jgi:hypothetical protein
MSVLSFLGFNLDSMQAFSYACLPLLDFFGQVIHFWIADWTTFIDAKDKLIMNFSYIVAY